MGVFPVDKAPVAHTKHTEVAQEVLGPVHTLTHTHTHTVDTTNRALSKAA